MKIFVFGSPDFGGHEIMALKILRVVIQSNADVCCFVNAVNARLLAELHDMKVRVTCFHHKASNIDLILGYLNPSWRSLSHSMQREFENVGARHVIIVNGNAVANHRLTLAIVKACERLSARSTVYIPMLHTAAELALSPLKSVFYTQAAKRGVGSSSDVLVISNTWKKRVASFCPLQSTVVVHNLVHSRGEQSFLKSRANPVLERLCFIGRYDRKQKGLDFLFDAMARICSHRAVTLDLIGDGEDRPFVDAAIAELPDSVASRIKQHGWLADPLPVLKQCDALLMPSRVEGAPLVALEARSLGIPVFAFDVPGVNDVVPARYLSQPFDVKHFADNVLNWNGNESPSSEDSDMEKYFDPLRFANEVRVALALG